jgi:hypothetical protein
LPSVYLVNKRLQSGVERGAALSGVDTKARAHRDDFDPPRGPGDRFRFALGLHECLARAVIPEIVRHLSRLDGLTAGPVGRNGSPCWSHGSWSWNGARSRRARESRWSAAMKRGFLL